MNVLIDPISQMVVVSTNALIAVDTSDDCFVSDRAIIYSPRPSSGVVVQQMEFPAESFQNYKMENGVPVLVNPLPPLPSPTIIEIETAIQSQLDSYAQSWGYNDCATACTYVGSTVAKFNNEGTALRNWRDQTWSTVEAVEAEIQAGTAQPPATIEDALALMPVAPARPS